MEKGHFYDIIETYTNEGEEEFMLEKIYKMMDKADKDRYKANKLNNKADRLDEDACIMFNELIKVEHIQQLYLKVRDKGVDDEKECIQELLNKKKKEKLDFEDLKKYRHLEEKYGENLDYNKSFFDRFIGYLED